MSGIYTPSVGNITVEAAGSRTNTFTGMDYGLWVAGKVLVVP